MKLGLVSCTKSKQNYACSAEEMYRPSALFTKAYGYAKKKYDQVAILSAKYGLLLPHEIIKPYELTLKTMGRKARRKWAERVYKQLKEKIDIHEIDEVYFHAGIDYREDLIPLLKKEGISVHTPLKGLRQGEQQRWYDRNKNMKNWKTELSKMSFLKEFHKDNSKKIYALNPPLKLNFSINAVEKIRKYYRPKLEGGGIMIAKPSLKHGDKILEVKEVIFLKNLSPTPERSFQFHKNDIFRIWKEKSDSDEENYIPIHFHSHPQIDLENVTGIGNIIASLTPLTPSERDQETSLDLDIKINGFDFLVPSALIVKSEIIGNEIIIGFYGGGVTPTDFSEYMTNVTGQTMEETWNVLKAWVKENPINMWVLILLGFLLSIPIVLRPKQAIPLYFTIFILLLASQAIPITKQEGKYFSILKKGLTIEIPEYTSTL